MKPDARARELLILPVETAQNAKWADGRAKYGPEWVGDHPLIELYMELLDAQNYLDHLENEGEKRDPWLRNHLAALLVHVRNRALELL